MKQQYLTLMCPTEHIQDMANAITEKGFEVLPNFPCAIFNSDHQISYWVFKVNVELDNTFSDPKQIALLELQDKYCVKMGD